MRYTELLLVQRHANRLRVCSLRDIAKANAKQAAAKCDSLQVSHLAQLEQLELLGSSGFFAPHLNSDSPNQVLDSLSAASANGHDNSHPDPSLQADPSQLCVHGAQQQSSGREQAGCATDIQAVGRLIVQLFRGRMLHHRATDHRQAGLFYEYAKAARDVRNVQKGARDMLQIVL